MGRAADEYVPGHGDRTFAVRHYRLELDYKVDTNHLAGRATLTVRINQRTNTLQLDLYGLTVAKVLVDGKRAARFTQRERKLRIRLTAEATAGQEVVVVVSYAGKPRPLPSVHGAVGWEELTDGALVAAQPNGAPSWFPCNDRLDDKASYDIIVTASSSYRVVANGVLVDSVSRYGKTTWHYRQSQPMASYLAVVHIGRYVVTTINPTVAIVHPRTLRVGPGTSFERQADMLATFTSLFGSYPFDAYHVVVTGDPLEIPLEAQSLSSFGCNHADPRWENERLVAHELSHQWFGNSLTASTWADIWLHEGFACYSEWLWSEASGGTPLAEQVRVHHARLAAAPQDLEIGRPGRELMFDDRVYKRGALTVHAVRLLLGDEKFFEMLRSWTTDNRYGLVSTPTFAEHVQRWTSEPVTDLLDAWLYSPELPGITARQP